VKSGKEQDEISKQGIAMHSTFFAVGGDKHMAQAELSQSTQTISRPRRRLAVMSIFILTLISLTVVLVPVWLIFPFRVQTHRTLELSYIFRLISPILTVIIAGAILFAMIRIWRGRRWWTKGAMIIALLLALFCTWAARFNHFELMFNPIKDPAYASTTEASFVADSDMVMAVEINGEAAAYPIRQLGYYHVVQDVVGGVPIVVTY
jgi:cation transport ATPase